MDYDKAAEFWTEKESASVKCPDVKERLEKFVSERSVCALAVGSGDFVRCTPLEYSWLDGAFWIFSEGGLKFRALKDNKNVCLAVFDTADGPNFGKLHSAQISGRAEIVEPFSDEYIKLLEYKKIPEAAVRKMPEPINLIKIIPAEADYLDSGLKKEGFDSRQHIEY